MDLLLIFCSVSELRIEGRREINDFYSVTPTKYLDILLEHFPLVLSFISNNSPHFEIPSDHVPFNI